MNLFAAITWPISFVLGGVLRWAIDKRLDRTTPR